MHKPSLLARSLPSNLAQASKYARIRIVHEGLVEGRKAGTPYFPSGLDTRRVFALSQQKTAATATTAATESRRKRAMEDLNVRNSNDGSGGKYHIGGKGQDESAGNSAGWSGEETEGLETEEEAKNEGREGYVGQALTTTA